MGKITREVQAACACGGQVKANIEKPSRLEHKIAKGLCDKCESKYIFTAYVDKEQPGRVVKLDGIILELSDKHREMVKSG